MDGKLLKWQTHDFLTLNFGIFLTKNYLCFKLCVSRLHIILVVTVIHTTKIGLRYSSEEQIDFLKYIFGKKTKCKKYFGNYPSRRPSEKIFLNTP